MNKAVLLSIHPKYCELIASGKKTIEVRKTRPKLEPPFKCYVYCTKDAKKYYYIDEFGNRQVELVPQKVIGEFVCDRIYEIGNFVSRFVIENDIALTNRIARKSCLEFDDMRAYLGDKDGYALHITDLEIYDTPKELGEFFVKGDCEREICIGCRNFHKGLGWLDGSTCDEDDCIEYGVKPLTRAPQSWCYIEEV